MLRDSKSTMRRNSGSVGVSLGVAAFALGDCSEETSKRLERTFPEAVEDAQRACQTLFSSKIHDRAEESEVCGKLSQERQRRCRTSAPPLLAVAPILQRKAHRVSRFPWLVLDLLFRISKKISEPFGSGNDECIFSIECLFL